MSTVQSVRVPDHVLSKPVDGELVLLNLENENYYGLDEVGAAMWRAIEESSTIDQAIEILNEQFDIDESTLRVDLDRLLGELSDRGLVEIT